MQYFFHLDISSVAAPEHQPDVIVWKGLTQEARDHSEASPNGPSDCSLRICDWLKAEIGLHGIELNAQWSSLPQISDTTEVGEGL